MDHYVWDRNKTKTCIFNYLHMCPNNMDTSDGILTLSSAYASHALTWYFHRTFKRKFYIFRRRRVKTWPWSKINSRSRVIFVTHPQAFPDDDERWRTSKIIFSIFFSWTKGGLVVSIYGQRDHKYANRNTVLQVIHTLFYAILWIL